MKPQSTARLMMETFIPFLGEKQNFPVRYAAVLLYVVEQGETTSNDIQMAFGITQPVAAQIIGALKTRGLVTTEKREGKREWVLPSEMSKGISRALEAVLRKGTQP